MMLSLPSPSITITIKMTTRYKPAKRGGGWGSLFFKLLGGKKGEVFKIVIVLITVVVLFMIVIIIVIINGTVRVPTIADYYVVRMGKKEKNPGHEMKIMIMIMIMLWR